jgi:hypothetical protein
MALDRVDTKQKIKAMTGQPAPMAVKCDRHWKACHEPGEQFPGG